MQRETDRVGKHGLLVVLAELDIAVLGEAEPEQEDDPHVLRADVEPVEVLRHPCLPLAEVGRRVVVVEAVNHHPPAANGTGRAARGVVGREETCAVKQPAGWGMGAGPPAIGRMPAGERRTGSALDE